MALVYKIIPSNKYPLGKEKIYEGYTFSNCLNDTNDVKYENYPYIIINCGYDDTIMKKRMSISVIIWTFNGLITEIIPRYCKKDKLVEVYDINDNKYEIFIGLADNKNKYIKSYEYEIKLKFQLFNKENVVFEVVKSIDDLDDSIFLKKTEN